MERFSYLNNFSQMKYNSCKNDKKCKALFAVITKTEYNYIFNTKTNEVISTSFEVNYSITQKEVKQFQEEVKKLHSFCEFDDKFEIDDKYVEYRTICYNLSNEFLPDRFQELFKK